MEGNGQGVNDCGHGFLVVLLSSGYPFALYGGGGISKETPVVLIIEYCTSIQKRGLTPR